MQYIQTSKQTAVLLSIWIESTMQQLIDISSLWVHSTAANLPCDTAAVQDVTDKHHIIHRPYTDVSSHWTYIAIPSVWDLAKSSSCDCGQWQIINHIVNLCLLTKFEGGLSLLHRADDDTVPGLLESMCNYSYFMSAAVAAALMK